MVCGTCGNKHAHRINIGHYNDVRYELCDQCGKLPAMWLPDVFLGGKGGIQTDENLCDKNGKEIPFSTKREKAAIMRMLKVRQADSAERQHGSRNETKRRTYFS